ncbi:hypothetical protein [Nonomuraea basaltis]|uniref:hypothetical protein n=1 Tax=Nonomuraea basaltis TaxID=2495887 RepID=UPI00110C4198|nr:hypothetical protein [Nonomuraea basaltis]TMR88308.1 hypothetical protein EJK15_67020 [Nonomuraea basaltis]
MTDDEFEKVLKYIAAADKRTFGKADLAVWGDIIGDLRFDDVMAAVRQHYRDSIDWLKPAHVRQAVRKARQDRSGRAVPAAPPAEVTDQPGVYKLHLVRAIAEIADQRFDTYQGLTASVEKEGPNKAFEEHPAAKRASERAQHQANERWEVGCPVAWCAAPADEPCRDRDGNNLPWQRTHSKRIVARRQAREARMNAATPRQAIV